MIGWAALSKKKRQKKFRNAQSIGGVTDAVFPGEEQLR
jgi:hypothetical protein